MKKLDALDYLFAIIVSGVNIANPFLFIGVAGMCREYNMPFGLIYTLFIILIAIAFLGFCKIGKSSS